MLKGSLSMTSPRPLPDAGTVQDSQQTSPAHPTPSDINGATSPWTYASTVSLTIAAFTPLILFLHFFPLVTNLPIWDQWIMIEVWEAYYQGGDYLSLLLKPYNGHINTIPKFVFFGLGLLTDWNLRIEVVLSYVTALGTLVITLLMLRDTDRRLMILAAPFAAVVFSAGQYENFMSGWPFVQHLSQFSATLALFALTRPKPIRPPHIMVGAIATIVATYSWGTGFTAGIVCFLALVSRARFPKWITFSWFVGTCALFTSVFVNVGDGLGRPSIGAVFSFFTAMVGNLVSVVATPDLKVAQTAGVILLVVLGAVVGVCLRKGMFEEVRRWGLFALMALAGDGMIAIGRTYSGIQQALVSHYITTGYPVVLTVLVLLVLLLIGPHREADPRPHVSPANLIAAAILILAATAQPWLVFSNHFPTQKRWSKICRDDMRKISSGTATDSEIIRSHEANVQMVRHGVKVLRRYRLAVFADIPGQYQGHYREQVPPTPTPGPEDLPSAAFKLHWKNLGFPTRVKAGTVVPTTLDVVNSSNHLWPTFENNDSKNGDAYKVRLSYRWLGAAHRLSDYNERRIDFESDVAPGAVVSLQFDIRVPRKAGRYKLQIDAVQDGVSWFEDRGAETLVLPVRVTER
ncbi:MAG: hypothetical protein DRJ61_04160 [Acidobacteria bacterium]|nr:MAG: hypothetical protein DRJ61_04160 [Acidobacteriota bacterium]